MFVQLASVPGVSHQFSAKLLALLALESSPHKCFKREKNAPKKRVSRPVPPHGAIQMNSVMLGITMLG